MAMTPPASPPRSGGGVFLALGAIVGAVAGMAMGQTTAGLLIGFGAGLSIALIQWLIQRRG
ncbi:hypothetical protein [Sphingomonas prati]|nr:hypothetical protein [Sphingomonas prati]